MKRILACLSLVMLLGASSSCSTESASRPDPVAGADRTASLDALFNRLQITDDDNEAHLIEVTIRHVWAQSGRQGVDALMKRAADSTHAGRLDDALAAADQVVAAAPDFAEGWNLRATIHYLRDDYGAAIADIEHVLVIEPRHFGALAGLGRIMLELEDKKSALRAFEAALAINPHLTDVRNQTEDLREQLAGVPI